nr:MAG: hypothetical protein [Lake Baikal virophage 5]
MSYSNFQLNQKINNLQNQINNISGSFDLQTVLDNGNTASGNIELTDTTGGYSNLDYKKLLFSNNITNATLEYTDSTDTLDITTTNINLNGQVSFDTPPHSVSPILGSDLTTKGYVDSLVGQYSGGYNLYLNYSETLTVNSINYKYLSNQVSSATQQDLVITTDGTAQLLATFITDEINLSVIPAGLWSLVLYGSVSSAGGVLYYYFKIKRYSAGIITDITTSGNSPDVNATPTGNPDAYHMNATIDTPIYISLTDRIIIEIYCLKVSGVNVQLNTYFESSYYSFIQTSLNAGTTLLTSDNNWKGNNNFAIIPTTITTTTGSNNTQITTTAYVYNTLVDYLTTASASSTYLSILDASSTYLSILDASSTYLSVFDASTFYLSISNAISTYLSITNASSTYLTIASAVASFTTSLLTITSPLTLPLLTTTPTTTQLGYFASNTNGTLTLSSVSQTPASSTITNLPIGIYMVNYYSISYSPTIGATQVMTYTISTTGGASSNIPQFVFSGVATTFQSSQRMSGIVKCTTAINTIRLNLIITSGGGNITVSNFGYNYIKIS